MTSSDVGFAIIISIYGLGIWCLFLGLFSYGFIYCGVRDWRSGYCDIRDWRKGFTRFNRNEIPSTDRTPKNYKYWWPE